LLTTTEKLFHGRPQLPEDEVKSKTNESHAPILLGDEIAIAGEIELWDFVMVQVDVETCQLE
jgi:hypothetical protein